MASVSEEYQDAVDASPSLISIKNNDNERPLTAVPCEIQDVNLTENPLSINSSVPLAKNATKFGKKTPLKSAITPRKALHNAPTKTPQRTQDLKTPATTPGRKRRSIISVPASKKKQKIVSIEKILSDEPPLSELGLRVDEVPLLKPPENIPKNLIGRRISLVWEMEDGSLKWGAGVVKKMRYKSKKCDDVVVMYDGDDGKLRNSRFEASLYSTNPNAPVGSWCAVSLPEELLQLREAQVKMSADDMEIQEEEEPAKQGSNSIMHDVDSFKKDTNEVDQNPESAPEALKSPVATNNAQTATSPMLMASKAVHVVTSAAKKIVGPFIGHIDMDEALLVVKDLPEQQADTEVEESNGVPNLQYEDIAQGSSNPLPAVQETVQVTVSSEIILRDV